MSLIKILRAGQVTLPADARKALALEEGDYLEAEVVEGELRLKPVSVVDRAGAWRQVREAQAAVRYTGPEPRPRPEEEEQEVYATVGEFRDRHG
jgi:AbrB family looped-hinge helix DNA binding protein